MKLYLILAFIGAALADAKFESQCAQKPDPGFCKARLPRWFLNTTTGKCEKFSYSGCGGNQNRFLIKEKCELTCITEMQNHLLLSTFGEKKARKPGGHLNRAVDEVSKPSSDSYAAGRHTPVFARRLSLVSTSTQEASPAARSSTAGAIATGTISLQYVTAWIHAGQARLVTPDRVRRRRLRSTLYFVSITGEIA
ncbi:uncharacterized protein LOC144134672 isoform X1 [Amblyomma americanum]